MAARRGSSTRSNLAARLGWMWVPVLAYPRLFIAAVFFVLVVGGGTYKIWKTVGPHVVQSPEYWLTPEKIHLNEPRQWITAADVKAQAVRDATLDEPLSILDENLNERIQRAFAAHPWVERVESVEKFHPARVEVRLVYRQPAAAVAVDSTLLPVDGKGILLPVEDFSRSELSKLPRISRITSRPLARAGNPWNDPRVHGAAMIAATFGEDWNELGLDEILPADRPEPGQVDLYQYELRSKAGTRIPWGRQSLAARPGEPSAEDKVLRLRKYAERYGSIDVSGRSAQLPNLEAVAPALR